MKRFLTNYLFKRLILPVLLKPAHGIKWLDVDEKNLKAFLEHDTGLKLLETFRQRAIDQALDVSSKDGMESICKASGAAHEAVCAYWSLVNLSRCDSVKSVEQLPVAHHDEATPEQDDSPILPEGYRAVQSSGMI